MLEWTSLTHLGTPLSCVQDLESSTLQQSVSATKSCKKHHEFPLRLEARKFILLRADSKADINFLQRSKSAKSSWEVSTCDTKTPDGSVREDIVRIIYSTIPERHDCDYLIVTLFPQATSFCLRRNQVQVLGSRWSD